MRRAALHRQTVERFSSQRLTNPRKFDFRLPAFASLGLDGLLLFCALRAAPGYCCSVLQRAPRAQLARTFFVRHVRVVKSNRQQVPESGLERLANLALSDATAVTDEQRQVAAVFVGRICVGPLCHAANFPPTT